MKWIISRYNQDIEWVKEYTDDVVLYDRSDGVIQNYIHVPLTEIHQVPNIGSDIYDKLTYIIDNYDNLPDVAVYTKANLFKFISKEEFDLIKDNKTFTPLLTQHHKTYSDEQGVVCFYKHDIYWEVNNLWYLSAYPVKYNVELIQWLLGIDNIEYVPFAPGSNYILPKENILKHSRELYQELRSYLEWDRYPGEAMVIERGLYTLWK